MRRDKLDIRQFVGGVFATTLLAMVVLAQCGKTSHPQAAMAFVGGVICVGLAGLCLAVGSVALVWVWNNPREVRAFCALCREAARHIAAWVRKWCLEPVFVAPVEDVAKKLRQRRAAATAPQEWAA